MNGLAEAELFYLQANERLELTRTIDVERDVFEAGLGVGLEKFDDALFAAEATCPNELERAGRGFLPVVSDTFDNIVVNTIWKDKRFVGNTLLDQLTVVVT